MLNEAVYTPFAKLLACDDAALEADAEDAEAELSEAALDALEVAVALDEAELADDAALELAPEEHPASITVKVISAAIAIALQNLSITASPTLID